MADKRLPLVIELGTEELPPKALDDLAGAFARGVVEGLEKRGVAADYASAKAYASPRRLAVHIADVAVAQPEQSVERRGPAVAASLRADGEPSKALLGFAQSCGVDVVALEKLETDKGAWFVFRAVKPGQPTAALLAEVVGDALKALPIPKAMRWGNRDDSFVRPVHTLLMLHGADIVDGEILGLKSGRLSNGHRFHHPKPVHVADADSWLDALRHAHVIADPAERRARVRDEVARVATGGIPRLSEGLLDEIANLTEWPVAIACTFERDFLDVPPEALVTTMETNQKFVPVFDAQGRLTEHFIGVANIESRDPAEIRKGYERVIRPRFADAKFFWDADLKTPLADYQEGLKNVTYQQSLGSLWDKTVRVAELARVIANRVDVDAGQATHAAALSKCDLLTRMVGEFPELQGVMGRYYATRQGIAADVADALDSFYQPRFGGDEIAAGKVGQVLAVAERFDTLASIFAVGMKPSGNKDPFALRRAALGLARTLIEGGLDIDLRATLTEALELVPETALVAGVKPGKDGKAPTVDIGARRPERGDEVHRPVRVRAGRSAGHLARLRPPPACRGRVRPPHRGSQPGRREQARGQHPAQAGRGSERGADRGHGGSRPFRAGCRARTVRRAGCRPHGHPRAAGQRRLHGNAGASVRVAGAGGPLLRRCAGERRKPGGPGQSSRTAGAAQGELRRHRRHL
jgi:glycyl-tRNA synthetase beta chain